MKEQGRLVFSGFNGEPIQGNAEIKRRILHETNTPKCHTTKSTDRPDLIVFNPL